MASGAVAPGQRQRPAAPGPKLTSSLSAELSQILIGAAGAPPNPGDPVVAFLTRAVLQYVESLANLALDYSAQSGTDLSADSVSTVLRDNFQSSQSAHLVSSWRRLRTMTLIDPVKAVMDGHPTSILSAAVLPSCPMRLALLEKESFELAAMNYISVPPPPQPTIPHFGAAPVGMGGKVVGSAPILRVPAEPVSVIRPAPQS